MSSTLHALYTLCKYRNQPTVCVIFRPLCYIAIYLRVFFLLFFLSFSLSFFLFLFLSFEMKKLIALKLSLNQFQIKTVEKLCRSLYAVHSFGFCDRIDSVSRQNFAKSQEKLCQSLFKFDMLQYSVIL